MKTPATRLIHLLIGKSIVETIFVGALAVAAFVNVVPPTFHGWGEVAENKNISGWAVNNASPWERVEVQLFVDGKFVATTIADKARPDVPAAGWARDPWHGYIFDVSQFPSGLHEARVFGLHTSLRGTQKSLQMLGEPIWFSVNGNGTVKSDSAMQTH